MNKREEEELKEAHNDRMTIKSSILNDRQLIIIIIIMKEILSNYAYEMKDKKHFISQSEYIILIVLIILVVIECFIMLHVFTKNMW